MAGCCWFRVVLGPAATLIPAFSLKGEGERAALGGRGCGARRPVWCGVSAGAEAVDSVSDYVVRGILLAEEEESMGVVVAAGWA